MHSLDTGKEKIKKICEALKTETLEPAKQKAKEIIENAFLQAEEIIANAKKEAAKILEEAQKESQQAKRAFETSLNLACRQSLEDLKLKIEHQIFQENIAELLSIPLNSPEIIAKLISAILASIEKEGTSGDISVYISEKISPKAVNDLLMKKVMETIREKGVLTGGFLGGVQVKLWERYLTIDMSLDAVRELVIRFIRPEFRNTVFKA